jgi:hypothetical protein
MVKQTTKSKKTILHSETIISRIYTFTCPHCSVTQKGYVSNEYVLMIRCPQCKNIIDFRDSEKEKKRLTQKLFREVSKK